MSAAKKAGVIYILTNPSFPDYVKIGYATNIENRLKQLNRSECIPFAFRVYATYDVSTPLQDKELQKLKEPETRKYLANAFRDGEIKTVGTDIDKLMPPVSRFGGGGRAQKKQGVIDKLKSFFDKFFGIGGNLFEVKNNDED